jgi:acyl-CoA hydrolase
VRSTTGSAAKDAKLVRFLPVEAVNDPALIARNRAVVSINGALSVDLVGQVVADQIGGRQYSGSAGTRSS